MKRGLAVLGAACALSGTAAAQATPNATTAACGADLPAGQVLEAAAGDWQVRFAPEGGRLPSGKHFALQLAVCGPAGATAPVLSRVDADMPAHRHGMNYRPSLTALQAPGRYRAEGLMLHMPGSWRFKFELREADGTLRRLDREIEVP